MTDGAHTREQTATRWWRRATVAATALACLAAGGLAAQPTSAAWNNAAHLRSGASTDFWRPWYGQLRLAGTQLCLDVPSRANGNGLTLQVYECNSTPAQVWTFMTDFSLRVYQSVGIDGPNDHPTARCLEQNQRNNSPAAATIESCNGLGNADLWDLVAVDGGYQVRNRAKVNNAYQCLDVPSGSQTQGTAVYTSPCAAANRARVWVPEFVPTVAY